ncbi:hypothetical protein J31TS4_13760 [Paenibacillus sp. J31TS4]|uniref:YtxH domain-containing protein n=1 Tax=Paenibacillus sp. J31TS4 TaxID=2807195 RepID=UPI001B0CE3FA|nr:YtxH domain-containing protein [Paenibacillus sp. J31TS4]GIP38096.1 hypothetical protein J31TS4_13760 [Paenibacillus sp. J31TS4]
MAEQKNGKPFVIGAVVGAVMGAATALLLAPKPGRELRKDIADQVTTLSDKTQEIAGQVSQSAHEVARSIGSQTSDWVGKAREVAQAVASEVKSWKEAQAGERAAEATVSSLSEASSEPVLSADEAAPKTEAAEERETVGVK